MSIRPALYKGICTSCALPIEKGDMIYHEPMTKSTRHLVCQHPCKECKCSNIEIGNHHKMNCSRWRAVSANLGNLGKVS